MKKIYSLAGSIVCAAMFLGTQSACAQSFNWVKGAGFNAAVYPQGVAIDHSHNEIVAGFSSGAMQFGDTTLNFYYDIDGYLAKYDSSGNFLWGWDLGGMGRESAYHVAVDASDNIYVVGEFNFGGGTSDYIHFSPSDSIALTASGTGNFFLAKYDANGHFLWARTGGASSGGHDCGAYAVAIDPSGDIVVGGYYDGPYATFATMTLSSTTLTGNDDNLFFAKYGPDGSLVWAKSISSSSLCWISAMATDASGNIYATGKISTSLFTGTTDTILSVADDDHVFYAKLNSSGDIQWTKAFGNSFASTTTANAYNCGNGIAVDNDGYIYMGGCLLDTLYVITDPDVELIVKQDGFVGKYNNDGSQVWMQRFGNDPMDNVYGVALDADGNPYMVGDFSTSADGGGSISFAGMSVAPPTYGTAMVAKLDASSGNAVWVKTGGGLNQDQAADIAIDHATGDVAITGNGEEMVTFDGLTASSSSGTAPFMYLARQHNYVPAGVAQVIARTSDYTIYPNPATDKVTVNMGTGVYHKIYITSVTGQLVNEIETTNSTAEIDVHGLPSGNYTLTIADNANSTFSTKLVKE